ncbi:MAG: hypothetical protein QGH94_20470, partial [Phycisphaerae bacterium]|nr:hypothetical protein [Phycisphaerae bacterium]
GIVPAWAREGGHDATLRRLGEPALRRRIGDEIEQGKQYSFGFGWDDMLILSVPDAKGKRKIVKPEKKGDKRVGMLEDWPAQPGVFCSFRASGRNYGAIGDLTIENSTDKPVTVTVPPGLLLDSDDPKVQDLYVANVPTETPCAGAGEIGKPITIPPHIAYAIKDIPGFCPDGEKDPPAAETEEKSVYTACKPDKKSATLLKAIAAVKQMDVGELKLKVFGEKKARAMVCQGALWQVDSRIDEEPDNEFTSEKLKKQFFTAFTTSAKAALDKMPPEKREKVESVVKDDIKKLVAAADFVTKKHAPKASVKNVRDV